MCRGWAGSAVAAASVIAALFSGALRGALGFAIALDTEWGGLGAGSTGASAAIGPAFTVEADGFAGAFSFNAVPTRLAASTGVATSVIAAVLACAVGVARDSAHALDAERGRTGAVAAGATAAIVTALFVLARRLTLDLAATLVTDRRRHGALAALPAAAILAALPAGTVRDAHDIGRVRRGQHILRYFVECIGSIGELQIGGPFGVIHEQVFAIASGHINNGLPFVGS